MKTRRIQITIALLVFFLLLAGLFYLNWQRTDGHEVYYPFNEETY